jgi:ferredoxin
VEPHLCVGCGACTTVCPTGALAYAYPDAPTTGQRLRTLVSTYARAGGRDAALLLHSEGAGARLLGELGRAARTDPDIHGLPARVLPVALWHTASVGLELWLTAKAQGASQVFVLLTDEEAPEYRAALAEQAEVANTLLAGLGYAGVHVQLLEARDARDLAALDATLRGAPPAASVRVPAAFAVQADKRATLELALEHLLAQAPQALPEAVALPAASPLGSITVDAGRCTLCLSCVGACPSAALADNPDKPQLRFIEKNCVQCGLCVGTCPEDALTLQPRLWLADEGKARKQARVLNEAQPYACIRCGKPFGTLQAVEAMLGRLAGHPMFQGEALQRLKMCGDCRVIDIYSNPNEVRITDL